MTSRDLVALFMIITGAILGIESVIRLIDQLLEKGGWHTAAGLLIVVIGVRSLDRVLHAVIELVSHRNVHPPIDRDHTSSRFE